MSQESAADIQHKTHIESLDREFQRNIHILEHSMESINCMEKPLASEWIYKLKAFPPNLSEALARNFIVKYLLRQTNKRNVVNWNLFSNPPHSQSGLYIQSSMPQKKSKKKVIKRLLGSSYDNGNFLSQLPVPRDGAIFVLQLSPNF
ncbi:uncharacterized protein LOC108607469 [Drosophila busckii]|uniref:uncharacterized protein LOC108607469 n=1 Tax=Drosophila busckii TaxID=30019 RepID=UPI001432D362|nr:uncharacterized protein LOC108607469 [Drosophila busckii]